MTFIDVHQKPSFSNVITFINEIVEYTSNDKLSKLLQLVNQLQSHDTNHFGFYDQQSNHVTIVNSGRLMTEAPYCIRVADQDVKINQPIDFVPIFTITDPQTNNVYFLTHSSLTPDCLKQYIYKYITKYCDTNTMIGAINIMKGYMLFNVK